MLHVLLGGASQRCRSALVAILSLALLSGSAFAVTKKKRGRSDDRSAPNKEEYYSTVATGVSEADMAKADELRRKTITSIKSLLDDKKINATREFELYLRLGELYAERHDYLRDLEMRAYEKNHDHWLKNGKKGKEPNLNSSGSRSELTRAANSFRVLVQKYPRHKRTASALYALGKTLGRLDNPNAVLYFQQLIKDHPKSELIPDAHLAMGEYYFEKHDISKAVTHYREMMKFKTHRAYPYAVYKLGWAYYNETPKNDADAAALAKKSVAAFKLVIRLSDKQTATFGRLNLRQEAIKDLVMVWAETEDIDSAWAYFRTISEQESFYDMLEKLGGIYVDQGRNEKAIEVYARLLKEAPTRTNNPNIHASLVALYERTNNPKAVYDTLKDMNQLYVKGSPWTVKNGRNEALVAEASKTVEFHLHRQGTLLHQNGQKTKNKNMQAVAAGIYEVYLESFASNPNAYEIRYYLADILFEFEKYEQASFHYSKVAQDRPKDGKYLKDAALAAVTSLNKADALVKHPKLPPAGQVPQPMAIPKVKTQLVTAIDNYVGLLPKEKDGFPMRFTAAQVFFDYGHYDKAMERFAKITEEIPTSKQAEVSIKLILGFYSDRQDWASVITWAQRFKGSKTVVDAGHGKTINDMLKAALFNRALAVEKSKNYTAAAEAFIAFHSEFPQDINADIALYNASLNYYRIGEIEKALAAGKKVLDDYPNSKTTADILVTSGETYESIANFPEAASYYQRFAVSFPNDNRASTALFNAAILNKGLQKYDEAVALLQRFADRYKKNDQVPQAILEIAQIRERQGQFKEAAARFEAYATIARDAEGRLFGHAKAAELTAMHVSPEKGFKMLRALKRDLERKDAPAAYEARRTVAATLFRRIDEGLARYRSLQINDGDKIERQVKAKQVVLVELAQGYEDIITVNSGEYTVASLYRLGELHDEFAKALFNAPAPKGSSQVDIDKFKTEIEKVAFPLRDDAFKFFETAYKRSKEVDSFTEWTRKTYQKMVELAPQQHPEVIEQSADPAYMSHRLKWDSSVARLAE